MIEIGSVVTIKILPNAYTTKYSHIISMKGVVRKVYAHRRTSRKYAIEIPNEFNHNSRDGFFWFAYHQIEEVKTIKIKTNNTSIQGKGKNMYNRNVVELYFSRKREEIQDSYNDAIKNLLLDDENIIDIINVMKSKAANAIDPFVCEHFLNNVTTTFNCFKTKETEKLIQEKGVLFEEQLKNLRNSNREVVTLLEACETYEQELSILIGYGIIEAASNGLRLG